MEIRPEEIQKLNETPFELFDKSLTVAATRRNYLSCLRKMMCEFLGPVLKGDPQLIQKQKSEYDKQGKKNTKLYFDADFEIRVNEFVQRAKADPEWSEAVLVKLAQEFKQTLDEKIDELISRKINLDEFFLKLNLNFELNFWNAIITSGYLIKLPETEIRNIQAIVDIINITQKEMKTEELKRKENTRKTLYMLGNHDKKKSIRSEVEELMKSQLEWCEDLKEVLEGDVDLEWFNPKEQIKTIKINPKYSHWQPKRTR